MPSKQTRKFWEYCMGLLSLKSPSVSLAARALPCLKNEFSKQYIMWEAVHYQIMYGIKEISCCTGLFCTEAPLCRLTFLFWQTKQLEFDHTPKKNLPDLNSFPLIGFSARFSIVMRLLSMLNPFRDDSQSCSNTKKESKRLIPHKRC